MQAIVKDKSGKKLVQFYFDPTFIKKIAKKFGITYEQYMIELATSKVEEKRKRKKK